LKNDTEKRIAFITNLQKAYSGTLISNTDSIKSITKIDVTNDSAIDNLAISFLNNNL
jgi:hypothetical protein